MSKATPPVPAPVPPAPIEISSPMEEFLEAHFKKLVLLFAVIALGAVIYGVVSYTAKANAEAAGAAFAAAKTVEDCDLVVSDFPGTLAAGNALLLKADLLWAQNKKDSSVEALREFTSKHQDHPLLPETTLALATKLESMGESAEAQPLFEEVISKHGTSDVAALAQIRLGDLLWAAGKEEEAKAAYESVPAKFTNADSAFIDQSEGRLKWISAKLPTKEVDGPPKPKVETPATPAPGAPNFQMGAPTLSPTLAPEGSAPQMQVSPAAPAPAPVPAPAAPEAPSVVTPAVEPPAAPAMPSPAVSQPAVPTAPATPKAEPAPAPAPEAPKVESAPEPAPAVPAPAPVPAPVPAPAEPTDPKVDVNPAPPAPAAPVPVPTPAPVPAPAEPAPPAPTPPSEPS